MSKDFHMASRSFERYKKFLKKAPRVTKFAIADTLNTFGFGVRKRALGIINSEMTVRNPKFIEKSMRVNRTRTGVSPDKMMTTFGSLVRPRFTGLAEQETGKQGPGDRVATTASREGSFASPMKGWARLKPSGKYPSPNKPMHLNKTRDKRDFGLQGLSGSKRIVAFLMIMHERKAATTFVIRRQFGRFKRGLYRFKQGVIKKLQSFDTKHKPKRVRWMTDGISKYFKERPAQKTWDKNFSRQAKKIK